MEIHRAMMIASARSGRWARKKTRGHDTFSMRFARKTARAGASNHHLSVDFHYSHNGPLRPDHEVVDPLDTVLPLGDLRHDLECFHCGT